MIKIDSPVQLTALLMLACLTSGCTSSELAHDSFAKDTAFDGIYDREDNPIVAAFDGICLGANSTPRDLRQTALNNGWQTAEASDLKRAGLVALQKLVLAIPGGGGRFDEEQMLFSRDTDGNVEILNLERRYSGEKTLATQCDIYGLHDFLKSCEALGKLLNRAPDHNQAYRQNGAHFIRWDVRLKGKKGVISCDKAPNSTTLPYSGISLSLKIDQSESRKPISSPPRAEMTTK